jgi:hypothetical protein
MRSLVCASIGIQWPIASFSMGLSRICDTLIASASTDTLPHVIAASNVLPDAITQSVDDTV